MSTQLRDGIHWVGHVDWTVRDFHGYRTESGSTYNAYLVKDTNAALIDTVKAPYAADLLDHLRALVPLEAIRYVVCNHAEPDHSGALPAVLRACPNAELVCDAKCRDALSRHYDAAAWKFRIVADGDALPLGARTLTFVETPMVHWPESMFTYVPEEKLLFSMDAFGQHYASSHRFDDEEPLDVVLAEVKTYFANIVMLYGRPIARVLERAAKLDIAMIAPSHGVIWRKNLAAILDAYRDWVVCKPRAKALVLYDTMWGSTAKMARAILDGAEADDVEAKLFSVRETHNTALVTEVLDAAAMAVGSPTLNGGLMPQMASFLTYLKGLRPAGKAGFAFGSHGWAKGGARDVQEYLKATGVALLREPLDCRYVPDENVLDECRQAGRMLADSARRLAAGSGAPPNP